MLVALGRFSVSALLENMVPVTKDQTKLHEFNQKRGFGSWTHRDGWGLGYLYKKEFMVRKSPRPFFQDTRRKNFRSLQSPLLLLHVRKASGTKVALRNTHPFVFTKKRKTFLFCHNGTIEDEIPYNAKFSPQGETDSEGFLYSIMTDAEKTSLFQAIKKNLKKYGEGRGSNIILTSPEKTYLGLAPTIFPKYFTMALLRTKQQLIISSEPLPGMKHLPWEDLLPGRILEIDNKTRKIKERII